MQQCVEQDTIIFEHIAIVLTCSDERV